MFPSIFVLGDEEKNSEVQTEQNKTGDIEQSSTNQTETIQSDFEPSQQGFAQSSFMQRTANDV